MKKLYKQIASDLQYYYDYYNCVYFDFIVEAVKNTITDFKGKIPSLGDIHYHIKRNYI